MPDDSGLLPIPDSSVFDFPGKLKMGERVRALLGSTKAVRVKATSNTCAECKWGRSQSYERLKNRATMTWETITNMTCSSDEKDNPLRTYPDSTCGSFKDNSNDKSEVKG